MTTPAPFIIPRNGSWRYHRPAWLLAFAISCTITLTNQVWVGGLSIYANDSTATREALHRVILSNQLPPSAESWISIGANGANIRLLTVWTAEVLHRATSLSLSHCYRIIETSAVLGCCILLFAFLESCAGPVFALCGLLYFGCVLPLTYLFHTFHPWDKPSVMTWLMALICVQRRRWWALGAVLAIGMIIKYDIVVFPLFVFLAEFRRDNWRASALLAAALFGLTFGIYVGLRWFAPGGLEPRDWMEYIWRNLASIKQYAIAYPPLIGLGIPASLAAVGYRSADNFAKAGVRFCAVLSVVLFVQTNFREFRAEVPLLLLLLPSAAFGIQRLFNLDWGVRVDIAPSVAPASARAPRP